MANRIEQARAAVDACIREAYLRAAAACFISFLTP